MVEFPQKTVLSTAHTEPQEIAITHMEPQKAAEPLALTAVETLPNEEATPVAIKAEKGEETAPILAVSTEKQTSTKKSNSIMRLALGCATSCLLHKLGSSSTASIPFGASATLLTKVLD